MLKALKLVFGPLSALFLFTACAAAQPRFDIYFGMGTAHDGSTHQLIDFTGSGAPIETPAMDGVFGNFGGAVMLTPSFGFGGEVLLRFQKADYAGLEYRPIFYDFNGIWTPGLGKHVMPEIQAGLGGLNLRFYNPNSYYYDYYTGQYSNFAGSSNHFQLHVAVGLRVYITDSVFIRPQVDYHWVRNMTEFNSSSVPAFTIAIGYSSAR